MDLKHKRVEMFEVDYKDLEKFIQDHANQEYDIVSGQECGNSSSIQIRVDGELDKYDVEMWSRFKKTGRGSCLLVVILNALCNDKLILPGQYLINVCW